MQAEEVICWPLSSGPTERDLTAMPLAFVMATGLPFGWTMLEDCQATDCPGAGEPLVRARAWAVQSSVAPAARESIGVSAARVGGVPPVKWA